MSEWISVKDRLPQSGYGVIVYCNGCVKCGFLRTFPPNYSGRAGRWRVGVGGTTTNNVTHWMLPEPPK